MSIDDSKGGHGYSMRPPGPGMPLYWLCMGCNTRRPSYGSKGQGVRRRCALCLAKSSTKESK